MSGVPPFLFFPALLVFLISLAGFDSVAAAEFVHLLFNDVRREFNVIPLFICSMVS